MGRAADARMPNGKYTLAWVERTPVGALLEKSASVFTSGDGARSLAYIGLDDVDRYSTLVPQAGT